MKKLLIGLSVLFVLLFSGCAPSSSPAPKSKVNLHHLIAKWRKDCTLNNSNGCISLGLAYANGQGVKQDWSKAKKYFSKACDLNEGRGCTLLGLLYNNGQGVKQDYLKAKKYFSKACSLNDGKGCGNLGLLYREGHGVEKDYSISNQYFGKACALKNQAGCTLHNAGLKFIGGMLLQGLSH